jgi:serine/threonine-protein kinase
MAAIFAGVHLLLGQRVAIKVMFAESAAQEGCVERFVREAQAAARVESEHVTRVMDAGLLDSGLPFLVMELLEGSDLGVLLEDRGPMPCSEVVDLALEALEGLAHVHAAGIVHRDLKPSNLFLARKPDGSSAVKLLDFGISKSLVEPQDDRAKILTGNVIVGSPVYMSPEQVRDARSVDPRSDMWSLAVSMYELTTGLLPFDGEGVGEVLAQILDGQPRSMRELRPEVSEGLDAVVMRCLRRDRDERYRDVAELARALAPFGRGGADERIARIEATLLNAPPSRASTSLGALRSTRATRPTPAPPLRSTRAGRRARTAAVAAIVALAGSCGGLQSAQREMPVAPGTETALAGAQSEEVLTSTALPEQGAAPVAGSSAQPPAQPATTGKPPARRAAASTIRPSFLRSRK